MKCKAFVDVKIGDGVHGLFLEDCTVPLEVAIARNLNSMEVFSFAECQSGLLVINEHNEGPQWRPRVLPIDGLPDAYRSKEGLLLYDSLCSMVSFILDRWVISTGRGRPKDSDMDLAVAEARKDRTDASKLSVIEQILLHEDLDVDNRDLQRDGRLFSSSDDIKNNLEDVRIDGSHRLFGLSIGNEPKRRQGFKGKLRSRAVIVQHWDRHGGHRIPRWDILVVEGKRNPFAHAFVEGRWSHGLLRRLPKEVLTHFDEQGRFVFVNDAELAMEEPFVAKFLVRVPRSLPRKAEESDGLPSVFAELPGAYIRGAGLPTVIADDVSVVVDPAKVRSILARTTQGIYMPDAAADASIEHLGEFGRGAWLAGCIPEVKLP